MAVSPADFELYSRATGTPLPQSPQEQMRLAPLVHNFIQNRGYQKEGFFDSALGRGIRNAALIGGAYALGNALTRDRNDPPDPPTGRKMVWAGGSGAETPLIDSSDTSPRGLLPPGAPEQPRERGGELIRRENFGVQPYESTSGDLADYGGRMGGINVQNPLKTGQVVGVDPHLVDIRQNKFNPFSEVIGSKVHTPTAVFTGEREVPLGMPAPLRNKMKGLPGTLTNIARSPGRIQVPWQEAATTGMEQMPHVPTGVGDAIGEVTGGLANVANLGVDAVSPWAGGALHLARFMGQNPGIAATTAINAAEKATRMGLATGAAVGQQGIGDIIDTGRIVARPARAGVRMIADATPGILAKGGADIEAVKTAIPALLQKASDDYDRGVVKPVVNYVGNKAVTDMDRVKNWENAARTAAAAKLLSGVETGVEHDLNDDPQNPDPDQVGSDENRITPQEAIHTEDEDDDPWR